MLHRTSSSQRRRRASRSAATSPQARSPRASAQTSRRASLATTETDDECDPMPPPQRSPRASLAPDAALDMYHRSPRHSLTPEARSARNSITPDAASNIRNNLTPSRNNLAVEMSYGSRLSLNPQDFNRSPRNSITPDATARTPRRSLVPEGTSWNQPRNSLVPDVGRSPRHSVASIQIDPARSQKELGPSPRTSPRGSIAADTPMKMKEGPEVSRSPRGSLVPDSQRSPRGSIAPSERSARGSLVAMEGDASRVSPRGSLTLTFQEPLVSKERRASEDSQAATRGRSVSPYRASLGGRQSGTGALSDTGSRRASSSVSQVSGDEQRRLCGEQAKYKERAGMGLGVGLTTYGSVAYQLKDANMEASGTVDFICRAARIMNRTILMTVFLAILSTLPVIMLIMGVQYIRDCPAEPRIPVYMVVGGAAGGAGICWLLWAQLASRSVNSSASVPERVLAYTLAVFLMGWFGFGNLWTLGIMWPDYAPTLFEPNQWCHRTLYVFALTQLGVVWGLVALTLLLLLALVVCQVFGCGWLGPPRYK
ncbi:serine/arginine repetitive matrix protein 2-like [Pectinophora gossypiella]|uniref:serine/arginine repetitive matrix protein 2-like n=1 Tax=Pectinophora gossypiella TaxID=13191 RepID=UPI00214E37D6|nr:serine/arginine repetitive matrix protein 2-like [Pectinophora gossypiella]